MTERRVVVTGLGVVAPNGVGVPAFLQALEQGTSGIRYLPELEASGFACRVGGIPQGTSELASALLSEEQRLTMNENMVFAALAASEAWTSAGFLLPAASDSHVYSEAGALIGTGIGGMDTIATKLVPKTDAGKVSRLGSTMVEQIMASGNTACVAGLLALGNRVSTNSSACSTGTEAIVEAFLRIRMGLAERMLAGGSESSSKYIWAGFDAMKVLNRTRNDAPTEASRPMSASAAGFVPGAGAGVLHLESLDSAERRGARIYAEVLGGFVNCGGHRNGGSMTAPNPEAVRRCIRGALAMARVSPDGIDAINGHLTATFADPHELRNWAAALEQKPERMPLLHSTKSLIGHTLGAAGGIECVASVLELSHGFVHGSLNCEDLHPAIMPFATRVVHQTVRPEKLEILAKASFGFGDVNSCVVFRKVH